MLKLGMYFSSAAFLESWSTDNRTISMKTDTPRVREEDIKALLEMKFKSDKEQHKEDYFTLCDTGDEVLTFFASSVGIANRMCLAVGVEFHEEMLMGVRVVRQETPYDLALKTTLYFLEFTEFM